MFTSQEQNPFLPRSRFTLWPPCCVNVVWNIHVTTLSSLSYLLLPHSFSYFRGIHRTVTCWSTVQQTIHICASLAGVIAFGASSQIFSIPQTQLVVRKDSMRLAAFCEHKHWGGRAVSWQIVPSIALDYRCLGSQYVVVLIGQDAVSYTHLTLPTIYSV